MVSFTGEPLSLWVITEALDFVALYQHSRAQTYPLHSCKSKDPPWTGVGADDSPCAPEHSLGIRRTLNHDGPSRPVTP